MSDEMRKTAATISVSYRARNPATNEPITDDATFAKIDGLISDYIVAMADSGEDGVPDGDEAEGTGNIAALNYHLRKWGVAAVIDDLDFSPPE